MKPAKSILAAIGLTLSGCICLLLFSQTDSSVDAQGILQEPFALLGGGYLLVGAGLLTGLIPLIEWLLYRR